MLTTPERSSPCNSLTSKVAIGWAVHALFHQVRLRRCACGLHAGSPQDMLALLKVGTFAASAPCLGGRGAEGMGSSLRTNHLFGVRSTEVAMPQAVLGLFFTDYLLGNRCTHTHIHTHTHTHTSRPLFPSLPPNAGWFPLWSCRELSLSYSPASLPLPSCRPQLSSI